MIIEKRLSSESSRDYAFRIIRKNIVNLEFEPGSIINEQGIADHLDCSRTPVREALQDLSRCEVVEVLPQRGNRIALIDYNIIDEIVFMRKSLECAAIDELCAKSESLDFSHLNQNIILQELNKNDPASFILLDDQFHAGIFEMDDRSNIYDAHLRMSVQLDRVRYMSLDKVDYNELIGEHREILRLIAEGDADNAKEVVIRHFMRYLKDKEAILAAYPERYFS